MPFAERKEKSIATSMSKNILKRTSESTHESAPADETGERRGPPAKKQKASTSTQNSEEVKIPYVTHIQDGKVNILPRTYQDGSKRLESHKVVNDKQADGTNVPTKRGYESRNISGGPSTEAALSENGGIKDLPMSHTGSLGRSIELVKMDEVRGRRSQKKQESHGPSQMPSNSGKWIPGNKETSKASTRTKKAASPAFKRGPFGPKKVDTTKRGGTDETDEYGLKTVFRPDVKRTVNTEVPVVKRTIARPRLQDSPNFHPDMSPVKRGRGRPRKHSLVKSGQKETRKVMEEEILPKVAEKSQPSSFRRGCNIQRPSPNAGSVPTGIASDREENRSRKVTLMVDTAQREARFVENSVATNGCTKMSSSPDVASSRRLTRSRKLPQSAMEPPEEDIPRFSPVLVMSGKLSNSPDAVTSNGKTCRPKKMPVSMDPEGVVATTSPKKKSRAAVINLDH